VEISANHVVNWSVKENKFNKTKITWSHWFFNNKKMMLEYEEI